MPARDRLWAQAGSCSRPLSAVATRAAPSRPAPAAALSSRSEGWLAGSLTADEIAAKADRGFDAGANVKQRIKTFFAGGVLALALFGVARAGPFEDAQEADQKDDYAKELQILRPLAEQGNAVAQLGLGVMYANGQGVPQDYAQAVVWYRKAAEQGDADAQTI